MRSVAVWVSLTVLAASLRAQAPASAGLWRVATASLAVPPALTAGPTASLWNPAADPGDHQLTVGIQLVQTPDVLGLSGVLAAVTQSVGTRFLVGAGVGRMAVSDLVRTTTSPSSQPGSIPVYSQFAGLTVRVSQGPARVGAALRLHDSRFDIDRDRGVTFDLGARLALLGRLTLAAASHFVPVDFSAQPTTDYYAGLQYEIASGMPLGGIRTRVVGRYGVAYRNTGDVEHAVGTGLTFADHLHVDANLTRESAYGGHEWRPGLGVALQIGRYHIGIARSSGLNDVGATYRFNLTVGIRR